MDITNIINMELGGLYGQEVIKEHNEIIKLYDIYEGKGQVWEQDTKDYVPTTKKTNKIKKLIKEESRFLFGKTPSFVVDTDREELNELIDTYINDILDNNLFSDKLIKGARDAFIGKRVAIKLHADRVNKQMKIMFVPSLEFVFEPFEDSVDELKKIVFFHSMNNEQDKSNQVIWKQKYEMVEGKCILNEGFYDGYGTLIETLSDNVDIGLSGIPAYVIINDGLSGDLKGESDVLELLDNAMAYNMLTSEDIDALKKGMNRIIYGTDVKPEASEKFKLKPGSYWDVETDPTADGKQAVIGTIATDFGYDTRIENTLSRIEKDMHDSLNIPLISLKDMQGTLTSGKGMKALYWSLITRCEEKMMTWRPALQWLVRAMLEMSIVYDIANIPLNIEELKNLDVRVENNYPLQEDEDNEMLNDLQKVNSQTMSRKSFIKKWNNVIDDVADEELKQIQLERQLLEEAYMQFEEGEEQ